MESTIITRAPRLTSASARLLPMKPMPPVTSTRLPENAVSTASVTGELLRSCRDQAADLPNVVGRQPDVERERDDLRGDLLSSGQAARQDAEVAVGRLQVDRGRIVDGGPDAAAIEPLAHCIAMLIPDHEQVVGMGVAGIDGRQRHTTRAVPIFRGEALTDRIVLVQVRELD